MGMSDEKHLCLVGIEECGCIHGVTVLGTDHDHLAYKDAASWAKQGARIEQMSVAALKARDLYCSPEHRELTGPPHWPRVKRLIRERAKAARTEAMPEGMGL